MNYIVILMSFPAIIPSIGYGWSDCLISYISTDLYIFYSIRLLETFNTTFNQYILYGMNAVQEN
jgi:hypothetical protein